MVNKPFRGSLAVLLLVAAGACSPSSTKTGPTTTPSGTTSAAITASDALKFSPSTVTVNVGQIVTWTNRGSIDHTVTFDGGPAFSQSLNTGATVTRAFTAAGTFAYYCSIHGQSMHGTIIVK